MRSPTVPRTAAASSERNHHDHGIGRHHARSSGGGGPLRTPDPPLESEDEAVHLPRAQRHLHHRPLANAVDAQPRVRRGQADVARRPRHSVRRHQEAGAGRRARRGRARRHVLREPALAGRHADQLRDDPEAHHAPARARGHAPARHLRSASQERSRAADRRAREAREVPGRHQGHAPSAGRDVHRRSEEGAHRRRRGAEAEDPDHRGDRHELRSRRDQLRDPGQRRRDPQRAPDGLDHRQRDRRRQDRDRVRVRRGRLRPAVRRARAEPEPAGV